MANNIAKLCSEEIQEQWLDYNVPFSNKEDFIHWVKQQTFLDNWAVLNANHYTLHAYYLENSQGICDILNIPS
jgi:hypothetical protein